MDQGEGTHCRRQSRRCGYDSVAAAGQAPESPRALYERVRASRQRYGILYLPDWEGNAFHAAATTSVQHRTVALAVFHPTSRWSPADAAEVLRDGLAALQA